MKVNFLFVVVVVVVAALADVASAFPAVEDARDTEGLGVRFRRVTCDVLSVSIPFGSLNHAGCAVHCLSKHKGYKGGRCVNGVCHCRK